MTVVACLLYLTLNSQPAALIVTGELISDHGNIWIVDISHSVEALNVDPINYYRYPMERDNCVKAERKHK